MAKQLLFENSVSLYDILFENIKIRASIGMQLRLDLILFIVQLGATGPPKYTFTMQSYIYSQKGRRLDKFFLFSPINALIELSNIDIN